MIYLRGETAVLTTKSEEDIQDQDEQLDCNGTCLRTYLDIFLKNTQIVNAQNDKRILVYRGQSDKSY